MSNAIVESHSNSPHKYQDVREDSPWIDVMVIYENNHVGDHKAKAPSDIHDAIVLKELPSEVEDNVEYKHRYNGSPYHSGIDIGNGRIRTRHNDWLFNYSRLIDYLLSVEVKYLIISYLITRLSSPLLEFSDKRLLLLLGTMESLG